MVQTFVAAGHRLGTASGIMLGQVIGLLVWRLLW
jgi:tetrahydromethanopterin S-methyltransferase subunit G